MKKYSDILEKHRDGLYKDQPYLVVQERNTNTPWKECEV